jgi:hypothetical protein
MAVMLKKIHYLISVPKERVNNKWNDLGYQFCVQATWKYRSCAANLGCNFYRSYEQQLPDSQMFIY